MMKALDFQTTDSRLRLLQFAGFLLFSAYAWIYSTHSEVPVVGAVLFAGAVSSFAVGSGWRWVANGFVIASAILLMFYSWQYFAERDYNPGYLFGRSMRVALGPLIVLSVLPKPNVRPLVSWIARVAVALAFIGHGLPALGVVTPSEKWFFMIESTIELEKEAATTFLLVVGILDVIAAVLILLPKRRLVILGLVYCAVWGLLTAMARPVAHFTTEGLDPWLAEGLLRFPHGLVPLYLLLCLKPHAEAQRRRDEE